MDLSTLNVAAAADRGADLHLAHPSTGEPLYTEDGKPVTIRLLGADSHEYRQRIRRLANQNLNKKKRERQNLEQIEEQAAELLAAITVGWSNIVLEGETVECNVDNAKSLYLDYAWIREQVDEFVGERANFLS